MDCRVKATAPGCKRAGKKVDKDRVLWEHCTQEKLGFGPGTPGKAGAGQKQGRASGKVYMRVGSNSSSFGSSAVRADYAASYMKEENIKWEA